MKRYYHISQIDCKSKQKKEKKEKKTQQKQKMHAPLITNFKFIHLFIFNVFIVNKFISVTTRIAFRKQQGLSQISGAVNKITEYC